MLKRLSSASILISISYLTLHFCHYSVGALFFLFITMAIAGFGLYEFYSMVEKKGSSSFMICGIIIGLCYTALQFLRLNPIGAMPEIPFSFVAFLVITLIFVAQMLHGPPTSPMFNFSMTLVGLIYVAWLFSFILRINYYPIPGAGKTILTSGTIYLIFAIAVTKGSDSFALFVGSALGKRKLAPAISPNKTVEGAVGAVVGGVIIGAIFWWLVKFPVEISLIQICVVSFVLAAIAQFGDLVESLLKRDAKIKDSGSKFPGLGGILDLIDSLLFALPAMYFFMKLWIIK